MQIHHNKNGEFYMPNIHSTISFGLVSIPVLMNPIIKNNDTSFNQLHSKCLSRVKYVKYCPVCKKELKETDIVKGYEFERDNYIIFDKEELSKLKPEDEHEVEVVSFIDLKSVDPVYFEKSYFLGIDNKSRAYELFYSALKKTGLSALAKCILNGKFYYAILRLNEEGIVLTTLYFKEEVNIPELTIKNESNSRELNLAVKLIESMKGKFEPDKYKDEYQDTIKNAIEDKLDGKKIKGTKKTRKTEVKSLMEALEKSLKDVK